MRIWMRLWGHAAVLTVAAALTGCCGGDKEPPPSRWDTPKATASATATAKGPAATATAEPKATEGSAFNKFFPADGVDGAKRVYTQEKDGFAEAKLTKDGNEIAVLSISDTSNNPTARTKFAKATEKIDGYPLVVLGKTQSSVLVKDRYQVKVASKTMTAEERKAWLQRFDLAGLNAL